MNVLMITIGSAGDVHPFIGLGRELQRRGHRVTLVTGEYFEPLARQAGIDFFDLTPEGWDYRTLLEDPRLWGKFSGASTVFKKAVGPGIRVGYEALAKLNVPGETIILSSSLALGARVARDHLNVPLVTVHLSPSLFRSVHESPLLPGLFMGPNVPAWYKRFQFWLADVLAIDPKLAPPLNQLLRELGLPRARRLLQDWWHSPDCVLGMFPEWFAPRQPDWPEQLHLVGFPLYDEADLAEPPAAVVEFLAAGPPPIAFTPGSGNIHGRAFFAAAADACRRLGRRGLLLTRFPEQIPADLPEGVRHVDFVPFTWLLPRCAAVVHHAGVGSVAQGMVAGIPQLLMPMAFDQFDNAARVKRLGVGDALTVRRFTGPNVAAALDQLLERSDAPRLSRELAERHSARTALNTSCDVIEQTFANHRGTTSPAVART